MIENAAAPSNNMAGKVALVTSWFWIIKILATTLGETGGDALSMTFNLGYAVSTGVFLAFFLITATAQITAKRYVPFLYWAVIVATTTVGTTTSDYLTRTAGLGYFWTSVMLFAGVLAVLGAWHLATGSVSVSRINSRKAEAFYWLVILTSNTLGTALGDYLADTRGIGYEGGALFFSALLILVAAFFRWTSISRPALFWAAFVLTRPLGATIGDLLTKPLDHGGLNLGRPASSAVLLAVMVPLIAIWSRKPEQAQDFEM